MNSVCVNLALPKCAERDCSYDRRFHLGDYGNQSDGNNTQCKKERPLLLALGVREYRLALLRPLARTLQPCRTGCCSACFCGMGNSCLEKEKPLGVRGELVRYLSATCTVSLSATCTVSLSAYPANSNLPFCSLLRKREASPFSFISRKIPL